MYGLNLLGAKVFTDWWIQVASAKTGEELLDAIKAYADA